MYLVKNFLFLVKRSLKTNPTAFFTCVLAMLHALVLLLNLRKIFSLQQNLCISIKILKSAFINQKILLGFPWSLQVCRLLSLLYLAAQQRSLPKQICGARSNFLQTAPPEPQLDGPGASKWPGVLPALQPQSF